ncbi:MAG: MmcQ/YjbR family DNA-binding protein [Gammaproteobacteria bacterium]|nr:MmcQ/YjbR family DNA-binding protein [Gammaproteobacteria bacterium]
MKIEALNSLLSGLKGAQASYPFGSEAWVYKVMGKLFALVCEEKSVSRVTLKCLPADGKSRVSHYESIAPGYYMNKKHWITLKDKQQLGAFD